MFNSLDYKHSRFYAKIVPSILGARVVSIRLPHKRKATNSVSIDKATGTHNGVASYFENKWGGGYYRIATREEEFLCVFDKNEDGTLDLNSVNENTDLYKVYGDVLRYCLYNGRIYEERGYTIEQKDIDLVPEWENNDQVAYKVKIEYRVIVEA